MIEMFAIFLAGAGVGAMGAAVLLCVMWDWQQDQADDPNEAGLWPL